ncbi:hypothetical protein [Halobacterium wangiae]|uniref:hypothetical protein n=1 Tax=Halobacterium wangiae TaxID=2902623 RepID=UPI001E34353D|nr:hypothetical protein [Halobacterium wangiae]
MAAQMASRLETFFEQRTDGALRSIVKYDYEGVDVVYLRGDVADQYSEAELLDAVDESRMQSISAPLYERAFSENHGDLECVVTCFEHVVEMNFTLEDGVGAAVALDVEALDDGHGIVSEARDIVVEERT